jgi:hypothetical protein
MTEGAKPEHSFVSGSPGHLAELMQPVRKVHMNWTPADIESIYHHQLSTPINVELGQLDAVTANRVREICAADGLLLSGIGDLLGHRNPPVDLLIIIKDFAKASMEHPESPLPTEVYAAIYWSCIAAAMVRCNVRISSLSSSQLRDGVQWALHQSWIAADRRDLFEKAMNLLAETSAT